MTTVVNEPPWDEYERGVQAAGMAVLPLIDPASTVELMRLLAEVVTRHRTVDGIRPHKPMTPAEHERARLAAEALTLDPEAARQIREEIRGAMATLAHVVAPVDLTLPKRGGLGRTACGEDLTSDTLMAMSADAISCPTCAAAYVADPSLLGPVEIRGTLNGTPTGEEIQR
jgi:hypothetical protein